MVVIGDPPPQNATKAHFAGIGGFLVTLIMYWGGHFLNFDPPPVEEAKEAFTSVGELILESLIHAGLAGGGLWTVVFAAPRNEDK